MTMVKTLECMNGKESNNVENMRENKNVEIGGQNESQTSRRTTTVRKM